MIVRGNQHYCQVESIFEGLSELEKDFMREELKAINKRTTSQLKAAAKKKATLQRIKWFIEDGKLVFAGAFLVTIILSAVMLITM